MKFDHILEAQQQAQQQAQLDEVRMGQSDLEKFINSPEAKGIRAGFEAEVVFRGLGGDSGELDYENGEMDWSARESINNIEDAADWFRDGDHNGRSEVQDLKNEMYEAYHEWIDEQLYERWDQVAEEKVREYIEENEFDEYDYIETYLSDDLDLSPEQVAMAIALGKDRGFASSRDRTKSMFDEEEELYANFVEARDHAFEELEALVKTALEDNNSEYENAREQWMEEARDDFSQSDWFESKGWHDTEDLYDNFASRYVMWPYWDYPQLQGGFNEYEAEKLGRELKGMLNADKTDPDTGEPLYGVRVSDGYHGAQRRENLWIFEPDSSLEPDNDDDMPVEIISPPMPLDECLRVIPEFFQWLEENDAYTNQSTGLHVGVSLPHVGGKVDYVKLAMFLGDQYVLDKFDRSDIHYCESSLKKIKQQSDPEDILATFDLLKSNLSELAAKQIKQARGHGKYSSINMKNDYIEFRIMGAGDEGKDYIQRLDDVMDTVKRYAYATYIASRPDLYRKEYAKKLYKNLSSSLPDQNPDTVARLSMLMANSSKLSPEALQEQLVKLRSTLKPIQANRQEQRKREDLYKRYPLDSTLWEWIVKTRNSYGEEIVTAIGKDEAIAKAKKANWRWEDYDVSSFRLTPVKPIVDVSDAPASQENAKSFDIFDRNNNNAVVAVFVAADDYAALARLERYEREHPGGRYGVRHSRVNAPSLDDVLEPQNQRDTSSGANFTGEWKVVSDATGDTVYQFGGVGNNQQDANRVAERWLEQNRAPLMTRGQGGSFSVLPVRSN